MKKITGKATALVLALALVVTSFSSTFAFAATTKSETGTATISTGSTVYLSNSGSLTNVSKSIVLDGTTGDWLKTGDYSLETYDHDTVADAKVAQVAHSSGDSLLKITKDSTTGVYTLALKSTSAKGTEVLSVLFTGTTVRDSDTYTVRGTATLTVKVVAAGTVYLSENDLADVTPGSTPDAVGNFYRSDIGTGSKTVNVFEVAPTTTNALAAYTDKTSAYTLTPGSTSTLNNSTTNNVFKLASTVGTGTNLRVTATKTGSSTTAATANFKVENTFSGAYTSIAKGDGTTPVSGATGAAVTSKSKTYAYDGSTYTDVTGANVITSEPVTVTDGKIADLTSSDTVTINGGTVGNVVADKAIDVSDGTVSSVKATATTSTDGDVTVSGGSVGTVKAAVDVNVKAGKVGDVTASGKVTVAPISDDATATVGKVSAKDLTVDATNAAAAASAFTATAKDGEVALVAKATIGAISFDYYNDTLDLSGFTGSVAAPTKATLSTIYANDADTNATVTGSVTVSELDLSDGTVKFTDAVKTGSVDGTGTLVINAGKLTVTDAINGAVVLKLADATTVKAGTPVYQATTEISDVDSFAPYGFTLKAVTGKTYDTFLVDKVQFAGIVIDQPDTKVVVNNSATFTASAYPAGTTLPAGYSISWDFTGADDFFTTTTNGSSITIAATKNDSTFTSLNSGTLTATVVDEYGYEVSDYGSASITVSSIAKPEYTSDTTANFSVEKGGKYTFKITSTTAPKFTLGTAGVFTSALTKQSGNDYFYTITAVGDVGKATGVFINDTKLLVVTVKAPVATFKSDTNSALKVAAGKSYTYKITSATAPSFGFGTAGVFTVSGITKSGNDYFYKVTAVGKAGAATGVFVNGVKVNVATVG